MATSKNNGKAIASLVLGILALLCIFTGPGVIIGLILAIVGMVLGSAAQKTCDEDSKGMAKAGYICSLIAIIVTGVATLLVIFGGMLLFSL